MDELDEEYPQYNFAENRGYWDPDHEEALIFYGACDEHRRSCRLVRRIERERLEG
jgi:ribonuclease HII